MFSVTIQPDTTGLLDRFFGEGELQTLMETHRLTASWVHESSKDPMEFFGLEMDSFLYVQAAQLVGRAVLREDGKVVAVLYTVAGYGVLWLSCSLPVQEAGTYWVGKSAGASTITKNGRLTFYSVKHIVPQPCLDSMARMVEAGLPPLLPAAGSATVGMMNGPLMSGCQGDTLSDFQGADVGTGIPRIYAPFMGVATAHIVSRNEGAYKFPVEAAWVDTFERTSQFALDNASKIKALNLSQTTDMMALLARKIPALAVRKSEPQGYVRLLLTEKEAAFWTSDASGTPLAKTSAYRLLQQQLLCDGCRAVVSSEKKCECGCGKVYCKKCACIQTCENCQKRGRNRTISTCCNSYTCGDCEGKCCIPCYSCDTFLPRDSSIKCSGCENRGHVWCLREMGSEGRGCTECARQCKDCRKWFLGLDGLHKHIAETTVCPKCLGCGCSSQLTCVLCGEKMCSTCLPRHFKDCLQLKTTRDQYTRDQARLHQPHPYRPPIVPYGNYANVRYGIGIDTTATNNTTATNTGPGDMTNY